MLVNIPYMDPMGIIINQQDVWTLLSWTYSTANKLLVGCRLDIWVHPYLPLQKPKTVLSINQTVIVHDPQLYGLHELWKARHNRDVTQNPAEISICTYHTHRHTHTCAQAHTHTLTHTHIYIYNINYIHKSVCACACI